MVALPSLILELTQTDTTAQEAGFNIMPSVPAQKVTFFDSCHDRQTLANGQGARKLLAKFAPEIAQAECAHHGANSLCCGAGGAVGSYDAEITSKRVWRIINEAQDTGAGAVVTTCPTCTYTIAQALLGAPDVQFENLHYLEILFNEKIDWAAVFGQLGSMWEGQWGPWLYATFYQ
jgi:Fe-S oxidoreductase